MRGFVAPILTSLLLIYSCKPLKLDKVSLITNDTVIVANNVVTVYGTIIDMGEADKIFDYGFMLNDSLFNTTTISKGSLYTPDSFKHSFARLSPDQEYSVVCYSDNGIEIVEGDTLQFILSSDDVTIDISNYHILDPKSASCDVSISDLGSMYLNKLGICYSKEELPTVVDRIEYKWNISNDTVRSFQITNLDTDSEYFYRGFAEFGNGIIIYSDSILSSMITSLKVSTDTHTITISNDTTVTMEGEIIDMGANPVIDHGFCWSYTTNSPNFNENVISNNIASGTGKYYSLLNNPHPNVNYYYRAYATDGESVKYGEIMVFNIQ
jgi:hypothetical protein